VDVQKDRLLVTAGKDSILEVDEIQFEGKKRMSVRDALNGVHIESGDTFTSGIDPS
jgi:methionyl-tRNA formyltransferase